MLRRDVLKVAAGGLATGLLAGLSARARAQTADMASNPGPAICAFNGKLYAVWRRSANENGLWFASFDGSKWSAEARIPRAASSANPSLAAFDNKLYAAWKGNNADERLWYASFDGSKWSAHAQIPDAASSSAPALSLFKNRLYIVWKASGTDDGLSHASFDGTTWSTMTSPTAMPNPTNVSNPTNPHPFTPQMIAGSGLSGAGGVDQGKHNDCVFEASAAAVATTARGQAAISQMIVQNSDGSYKVTFPGAPQRPVKVAQSDLKSSGVHDSSTWADVLETALILSEPYFANGGHLPPNAKGSADGSAPTPAQYAMYLLTGNPASKDVATSPRIGNKIAKALGDGQPVVAFCCNNDERALVSGHEWTVIACKPKDDQIIVRNPWGRFGTAGKTKAGVTYDGNAEVTMNLQQFSQYYKEVTFGYSRA